MASLAAFADLLAALGRDGDERLSVCHRNGSATFVAELTTVAQAPSLAYSYADGDCWFGVNPLSPTLTTGRGSIADVVGIRALVADLDFKPGGIGDEHTATAVVQELSGMLGVRPAWWTHSGHGWQVLWAVERDGDSDWSDDAARQRAVSLARRFGRLAASVAERQGGALDTVSDLTRVLRVPGTVNRKDPTLPVPVKGAPVGGSPIALAALAEVLDEYDLPEQPEDRVVPGVVLSPPADWRWGQQTSAYVTAMVNGWRTDTSTERHPWLLSQAIRLAAAHRLGQITEQNHAVAWQALVERFTELLTRQPARPMARGELAGVGAYAIEKVAAMTDEQAGEQIGESARTAASAAPPRLFVDVAALLAGGLPKPPTPTICRRHDGAGLFYAGQVNVVFGDPEAGKTLLVYAAATQVLADGGSVLLVDADHNGAEQVLSRLLAFQVPQRVLEDGQRFRLAEPEDSEHVRAIVAQAAQWCPTLAVFDSVGEIVPLLRRDSNSPDEWTEANRVAFQPYASAGAAVVVIDHLAKGSDSRTWGQSGTTAKVRTTGGTSLRMTLLEPFVPGSGGKALLTIRKDRPGGLRRVSPVGGREQVAGVFVLSPSLDTANGQAGVTWTVREQNTQEKTPTAPAYVPSFAELARIDKLPSDKRTQRGVKDELKVGSDRAVAILAEYKRQKGDQDRQRSLLLDPRGEEQGAGEPSEGSDPDALPAEGASPVPNGSAALPERSGTGDDDRDTEFLARPKDCPHPIDSRKVTRDDNGAPVEMVCGDCGTPNPAPRRQP